jgi:hypothetical protein
MENLQLATGMIEEDRSEGGLQIYILQFLDRFRAIIIWIGATVYMKKSKSNTSQKICRIKNVIQTNQYL